MIEQDLTKEPIVEELQTSSPRIELAGMVCVELGDGKTIFVRSEIDKDFVKKHAGFMKGGENYGK